MKDFWWGFLTCYWIAGFSFYLSLEPNDSTMKPRFPLIVPLMIALIWPYMNFGGPLTLPKWLFVKR